MSTTPRSQSFSAPCFSIASVRLAARRSLEAIGLAAVAAAVLLSWPGVQAARADEPLLMSVDPARVEAQAPSPERAQPTREAPTCADPGSPTTLDDAMVTHQAKQMLRKLAQRIEAPPPPGQPWIAATDQGVVLNSRGYNYHPEYRAPAPPAPDPPAAPAP